MPHPFWKGKIPSSEENSPFLRESTLFIRETPFLIRLPIIFFGGEGWAQIFGESPGFSGSGL